MKWKWILIASWLLAAEPARAHGAFPTAEAIGFGPGAGEILFGTNFGAILLARDGAQRFICETAVTGLPQALSGWLWLASGEVLGITASGGLARGVFASDSSACRYDVVPGTGDFAMTDLAPDPSDGSAFYATGADDTRVVMLHGRPGEVANVLYSDATAPLPEATGVRAGGGHAYAVLSRVGAATLVHYDGVATTTTVHPVEGTLRPLGVSSTAPRTLWLTHSTATGDELLLSDDAGATMEPVLTVEARIEGFAMSGNVVWVQSAQLGIHRSEDGGRTFAPLAGSPIGNCLALGPDARLYACGVPWRDGFALGVSDDGRSFTTVIGFFDDIQGAIACPAFPETTTTCDAELAFIREFYGFGTPVTPVEPGPEAGPEPVEPAEPKPEASVESAEAVALEEPPARSAGGCASGSQGGLDGLWVLLASLTPLTGRRRLVPASTPAE